jgi:hypothetical protein
MWDSITNTYNPKLYSYTRYRSCVNRYQFLLDRGAEKAKRNYQARAWKQIMYKKIVFKPKLLTLQDQTKPISLRATDPNLVPPKRIFKRLWGMRTINLNILAPTQNINPNQQSTYEQSEDKGLIRNQNYQNLQPKPFSMDPNYEYWIYIRWQMPRVIKDIKDDNTLPSTDFSLYPIVQAQWGNIWWEDLSSYFFHFIFF